MPEDYDDHMIYCDKCDMCGNTTHISSYTQCQNTENAQDVQRMSISQLYA